MATLARQLPSVDTFLCEPWSSFVGAARLCPVDNSSVESGDGEPRCLGEVVQFGEQDMLRCCRLSVLKDFCLVVCHVCNQVVTPQGILTHYDKRHVSPVPSQSPLVPMKPKVPAAVAPSPGDAFRVPKDLPHSRFNKAPLAVYPPKGARNKTCVSLPVVSLEKMPCPVRTDSASRGRLTSTRTNSAPSSLKPSSLPQRGSEKLTNGRMAPSPSSLDRCSSPVRSLMDRKPSLLPTLAQRPAAMPLSSSQSLPFEKKHTNGTKSSSSKPQKRVSGRVFDPNKHCGVQDPETKRPCTRSLTCKTHSLTHRRAVPGRRKHFDVLLAEHKGRPKEGAREKDKNGAPGGKEAVEQPESASPSRPHCHNGQSVSTLKLRLASAHILRVPGLSSSNSSAAPPATAPTPAATPESSLLNSTAAGGDGCRLSSDEGDGKLTQDSVTPACHYSDHHPQPAKLCVFSGRLVGRGSYVFDRRWDRMRRALQRMVEKHLNAQMWRKVPLAPDSLGLSSPLPTSSSSFSIVPTSLYTVTFPQSAAAFSIRDPSTHPAAPLDSPPAKARNGVHAASRLPRMPEEQAPGSAKRRNSSYVSSLPPPLSFPLVDDSRRNGSGYQTTPPGSAAKRKGGGGGGWFGHGRLWGDREDSLLKAEVSLNHNSHDSFSGGDHRRSPSVPQLPLAAPCRPSAHQPGADGRKRRSPSALREKPSKLSRPDGGGVLTSGPESPRQQGRLHH